MPDTLPAGSPGSNGSTDGDDRRQFERVPAKIEVRFSHPADAARALRAYSLNLSVGGLCLKTQRKYELGDILKLEMKVQGHAFALQAVVAWIRPGAIGVRFQDVSDVDRDRLSQLVTTFKR
jgi:uncharacterized protein (TIGR02266 family)